MSESLPHGDDHSSNCDADVIVAASSRDMNLYYLTRFVAGDLFIFIRTRQARDADRTYMVVTNLERGRAEDQARVDEIMSYPEFVLRCRQKGIDEPQIEHVLCEALRELGARRIAVPYDFPLRIGDTLRDSGFEVLPRAAGLPFVPERVVKTEEEIAEMRRAMEANEAAVRAAVEMIADSEIRKGMLYDADGSLTSERVKKGIARDLFERGYSATQTIVAAGDQGCNPHNAGSGPLPAHSPIIIDVFPRSKRTRYCADITRTVVRGKASDRVRRMFDAVLAAQHLVFESLADGVDGGAVHRKVQELFEARGFPTGPNANGRMEGFFHGTGHGLGLEIHELPRFNRSRSIFRAGMVVTVEPGLYYLGTGGVRLEDAVVIREQGCENLCTFEKRLEI